MKLMVEEKSATVALDLLRESDRRYLQTVPCPRCKHLTLEFITITKRYNSFIGKIKSLLLNGQEQEVKQFYRCVNCGHEITELP
jgi:phage FluMu protein Com